jgi:predicted acylesterase/phospholipase RssA
MVQQHGGFMMAEQNSGGQLGKPIANAKRKKRAICLGGGGPAAGLHIGVLDFLKDKRDREGHKIEFDVWALSCVGAWVGAVYNQAKPGKEIEETYNFFHGIFRDDKVFQSFPINTIFGPDWAGNAEAMKDFLFEPDNYKNLFLPRQVMQSLAHTMSLLSRKRRKWRWNEGDINNFIFNHVLAVNPAVRLWMALMFKSEIDGVARLYYPKSEFIKSIRIEELDKDGKPYLFHNAFNFRTKDIDLFANNSPKWGRKGHKAMSAASLCACSALPYVEQTVEIDGNTYCEGALIDTVNFKKLLEDHHHPDKNDSLDEIWISRIVDAHQIRKPKNLHDAFANLCQLFAASLGEDDVRLFEYHVREDAHKPNAFKGTIVEIRVDSKINFEWSHENLKLSRERGELAAKEAYNRYMAGKPPEPALNAGLPSVTIIR